MRAGVLASVVFVLAASAAAGLASARTVRPVGPGLEQLVGQRLVVAMRGIAPGARLLERVRQGPVRRGILCGGNVRSAAQVRAVPAGLQGEAGAGGMPPLLIAVDQEGGRIRRFTWAPPERSAAELGALAPPQLRTEGHATAGALRE